MPPSPNSNSFIRVAFKIDYANVRYSPLISTSRRNTGGQLAINNDDGLANARPIAFSESLRNQLSHNVIFSAALVPPRNL